MAQTQLTLAQRYKIHALVQTKISNRRIAEIVNVHHSTISREIKRNSQNSSYEPETADKMAKNRRATARKQHKISPGTWRIVEKLLKLDFSPQQIAGYFERTGIKLISHESIYQYILADKSNGGTLWTHLRWSHKRRRKRYV